tara:strand:- start:6504 stop:6857 length:354 start_codon:yes stop_codon:yes gene_type:complete
MNIFYFLKTCDTCKRIIKTLNIPRSVSLINIKENPISSEQLDALFKITNSYAALFNRRAQLIRKRGLKASDLSEEEIKNLILEHYSFLKRPVLIYKEELFIGNSAATVEAAKRTIHE